MTTSPEAEQTFAKIFDTAHGQLLVFLDETDDGEPAISVIGADVRGVRPKAKLSGWADGEEAQLRNFEKTDQAMAEDFAAQLHRTADQLAPESAS